MMPTLQTLQDSSSQPPPAVQVAADSDVGTGLCVWSSLWHREVHWVCGIRRVQAQGEGECNKES